MLPETDPALLGVLAELQEREPLFHRPELESPGPARLGAG